MEEKTILIVSVICLMIGLSALYIIAENTDVNEVNNIESYIDQDVKIVGYAKRVSVKEGVTFIEVEKKQIVPIVFFKELDLNQSDKVEIIGRVSKYNDGFEIIGKNIIKK